MGWQFRTDQELAEVIARREETRRTCARQAGHVGFFAGLDGASVKVLGGNQSNAVSIQNFPIASVLGVRRLA